MEKVVEMKGITKVFPGVVANENVDFDLEKGEIHVLLGENGAGKTTLMNVLYGLYLQEAGTILIKGREESITNPSRAIDLGIGMIHQHFMLVDIFTVTQNIILGNEPVEGLKINIKDATEEIRELADRYGFNVDPTAYIKDLTVGQQQKVEILKALYRKTDILILDEPTAVLTPQEIDELEVILKNLTAEGKSVILITHKLKEIMSMSDRVTILRRGKVVGQVLTKDTSIPELAELMVGREVRFSVDKEPKQPGEEVLKVTGLKYKDERGVYKLKDLNLTARPGEILGIAGVDGNGQSELIDILTGIRRSESGSIQLKGEELNRLSPEKIISSGVSSIPEDRHKRGLILDFSLYENAILGQHKQPKFSKGPSLNYGVIKEYTRGLIENFDIRTPSENVAAGTLSGGNQQKLVAAREISKDPLVLIAAQPTRGLDVGAIEYIHSRLVGERDRDKAVILVSLDLEEIMNLSDRISVIYDGHIAATMDRADATEQKLGILMAGGSLDGQLAEDQTVKPQAEEDKEVRDPESAQDELLKEDPLAEGKDPAVQSDADVSRTGYEVSPPGLAERGAGEEDGHGN